MKRVINYIAYLWFFCCIENVYATPRPGPSYGEIADNLLGPVTGIISIVRAISIIAGVCLILSSFVKFADYRRNHHEISLAVVITQCIAGICLVIVGFIPFQGM